jgi:hypothetical protein
MAQVEMDEKARLWSFSLRVIEVSQLSGTNGMIGRDAVSLL